VTVAKGVSAQSMQLPIVLIIPKFYSSYSMLGSGDIVLPGILISYLLRCDRILV